MRRNCGRSAKGSAAAGERAEEKSIYTDANGDTAYIPAEFMVSAKSDEQTIGNGLVIIGPDGSEFVWVPTTVTALEVIWEVLRFVKNG